MCKTQKDKQTLKLAEALTILELSALPLNKEELTKQFRRLAKSRHPDAGGSGEGFKELNAAYQYALKALDLVAQRESAARMDAEQSEEERLKEQRRKMREAMLRRRAAEDRKRNKEANRTLAVIGSLVLVYLVFLWTKPALTHWIIEQNKVQSLAVVYPSMEPERVLIRWNYNGEELEEEIRTPLKDGKWLVGPSGMPLLYGNEYLVSFHATKPRYFELNDEFFSPKTAEAYFDISSPALAYQMGLSEDDPVLVCSFWSLLEAYGVEGIAEAFWSSTPRRKNWRHNVQTWEAFSQSAGWKEIVNTCSGE